MWQFLLIWSVGSFPVATVIGRYLKGEDHDPQRLVSPNH